MSMKIKIISIETIKPSSPTPPHLRDFTITLLDQLAPPQYIPVVFFYPLLNDPTQVTKNLKMSLAKTLTRFYPLAGTIKDGLGIECNDSGAVFTETRVEFIDLSSIMKKPDFNIIKQFLPAGVDSSQSRKGPLFLAQANFFRSGGLAIGVYLSHKIADAATLTTFIKSWAATAAIAATAATAANLNRTTETETKVEEIYPYFLPDTMFSPITDPSKLPSPFEFNKGTYVRSNRFVFDSAKIAKLKTDSASRVVKQPTRVEAVAALIWKCLMKNSGGVDDSKPSMLAVVMNIRKRMVPLMFPENTMGSIVGYSFAETDETDMNKSELEVKDLVGMIRKGVEDFKDSILMTAMQVELEEMQYFISEYIKELNRLMESDDVDLYSCSSWCRFSLYEAADFGWGKPVWINAADDSFTDTIVLLDSRDGDGSIEAFVTLDEDVMTKFEVDRDLVKYATCNPSIII